MPERPAPSVRLPVRLADGAIGLYQHTLSPVLAALAPSCGCRFAPTCSHYARQALREHGFFAGLGLSGRRLLKCGPWHPGGLDPVPPSPRPRWTNAPDSAHARVTAAPASASSWVSHA